MSAESSGLDDRPGKEQESDFVGRRLGEYVIERQLGQGGMGLVFAATHTLIRRRAALKILKVADPDRESATARFEREVRLSARLTHPNTITIYDYGRTPEDEFYYAMEYLEGLDLQNMVERFGPMTAARVAFVLSQVCGSLSEAHSLGIVHRDVKPSNIFLTRRGDLYDWVKILDFGLAKRIKSDELPQITATGVVFGTPLFIAPEAAYGAEKIDPRSDIYSLGAVAYWMLTGRPPFVSGSRVELIVQHVKAEPPQPSKMTENPIPRELEEIVMRCLAKGADDRFQTAGELETALNGLQFEEPWGHGAARTWWGLHGHDVFTPPDSEPSGAIFEAAGEAGGAPEALEPASPILKRLREALASQFEVERVLGAGGMGTVFLARDLTLERRVAIKILRPELATAKAAERFIREARILASLSHPNVVPVHSAGEADGLFYYVMDFVEGRTLAQRLQDSTLSPREAEELGSDLLSALEAAHERGVIHRDVKPSNIFLVEGRALLSDFGVAKETGDESPGLTGTGQGVGTPGYMAPEQAEGAATRKSDLYAVGVILFEALTGNRWSISMPAEAVDWSAVPARLRRVLRRALALAPDDRWESASAFKLALGGRARAPARRSVWAYAMAAVALLAVVAVSIWLLRPTPPRSLASDGGFDLAILPVEIVGGQEELPFDGGSLASGLVGMLRVPDLSVVPPQRAFAWDSANAEAGSARLEYAARELDARLAAHVTLYARPDSPYVDLQVVDERGEYLPGFPRRMGLTRLDVLQLSDSIRLRLLLVAGVEQAELDRMTAVPDALIQYLWGERAFERGDWGRARRHYESAIERDSSFVQAWWHLANTWRWLGKPGPHPWDYRRLLEAYGSRLGTVDSMLMAAQLAPPGEPRLAIYRAAHEQNPLDYFAAYLYGEELFNRGPLWGRSLESATAVLETTVALNPRWAAAQVLLGWAAIRLGRAGAAGDALDDLRRAPQVEYTWLDSRELLAQAYVERFGSREEIEAARDALFTHPTFGAPDTLAIVARLGLALDLPWTQLDFGRHVVEQAARLPAVRASAHVAQGLSLVALGRLNAARAQFDSAASAYGGAEAHEARLQAAEWRVLPRALLGLDADTLELERGRDALEALLADGSAGFRAAWALAIDAYAADETVKARRYSDRLATAPHGDARTLETLLRAIDAAERGELRQALDLSEQVLESQTSTRQLQGSDYALGLGDPFARSALHLLRGRWFAELGESVAAQREYVWYEAVDIAGYPGLGMPQTGEIDWSLSNHGRLLRGLALLERGEDEAACELLGRVVDLWSQAEHTIAPLALDARFRKQRACGD